MDIPPTINHYDNLKYFLIGGLVLLLISVIIIATIYTVSIKQTKPNEKSKNRMFQLNEILIGSFGRNWPYLLMFIMLLLIILLILFYSRVTNNSPILNLSDNASKVLLWGTIIISFFISIAVIGLFIQMFLSPNNAIPNYIPDESNKKEILLLGGLGVVLLIVVIIVFAFFKKIFQKK